MTAIRVLLAEDHETVQYMAAEAGRMALANAAGIEAADHVAGEQSQALGPVEDLDAGAGVDVLGHDPKSQLSPAS